MTMNQSDRQWIDGKFKDMYTKMDNHACKVETNMENFERRVRALEDWKIAFVAKFTVYSAIALFLGSIVAQVGMAILLTFFR